MNSCMYSTCSRFVLSSTTHFSRTRKILFSSDFISICFLHQDLPSKNVVMGSALPLIFIWPLHSQLYPFSVSTVAVSWRHCNATTNVLGILTVVERSFSWLRERLEHECGRLLLLSPFEMQRLRCRPKYHTAASEIRSLRPLQDRGWSLQIQHWVRDVTAVC